jgi:hypothetical protein
VYVLFKDAFVSEGEAAQAEQLGRALAPLTPLRLDLHAGSEQSQDSLPGFLRAAVKNTSVRLPARHVPTPCWRAPKARGIRTNRDFSIALQLNSYHCE